MAIVHGSAAFTLESMEETFGDHVRQRFIDALANGTDTPEARYMRAEYFAVYERYDHQFGLTVEGVMTFWTLVIADEISSEWWAFVSEELIERFLLPFGRLSQGNRFGVGAIHG